MVLDVTRKLRQAGQGLLVAAALAAGAGCTAGPEEARNARLQNQRLDKMEKCREELARTDPPSAARSQAPVVPPPDVTNGSSPAAITPVANVAAEPAKPAAPLLQGEPQVRIVATIGTTPVYEREVREAVYQRLPEIMGLAAHERKAKEKEMFAEELRRLIERELILDELFAMLNQKKQTAAMNQLKEAAAKDARQRLADIQKRAKLPGEDELKMFLNSQGLTISGVRRHFERSFMMSAYLGERLKPKMSTIMLIDIRDYYEEHADEFKTDDRVKWQDLFVRTDRFRSRDDAKKYADWLARRAAKDDFVKLVDEFDMGDSKSRGGMGFGEQRGKIFPPELEPTVFGMKQGQVAVVEFESGYHVVRVAERTHAGKRPFDEQVQAEIRRKLQAVLNEREYRKIVDTLWRRSQPQILVD